MTDLEFINLHQVGILDYSGRINVNIVDNGDGTGRIQSLTVSVNAISVNGSVQPRDVNIENILAQINSIKFTYYGVIYELDVLGKTRYIPLDNGVPYYFYTVSSNLVVNLLDASIFSGGSYDPSIVQDNTQISFTPFINDILFSLSEYNPLYNNSLNLRLSTSRVQSDRISGFTTPTNLDAITSGSATLAQVQDSFYTTTGIINGRYNGSKSTQDNYGGVKPSLSVRRFEGEVYTSDADVKLVCGTLESNRVLIEIAHTGEQTLPSFSSSSLGIVTSNSINSSNQNIITYQGILTGSIDQGDILQIVGNEGTEKIRVVQHNAFNTLLVVQRGYLGSVANSSINVGTSITTLDRNDILRFEGNTSKLAAVNNSIIYVKANNNLIYTDDFGTIYSSSQCPTPTFLYLGSEDV